MSIKPILVGIAGVAHVHAPGWMNEVQHLADTQLVGIWDPNPALAQTTADKYATRAFATLADLLAEIDTLFIASENVHHHGIALAAAAARIPTLCEKPLATTVADAQAMVDAFAAAGVQLGTAFPVRYSPAIQRLRNTIQSGSVGETLLIRATNHGTFPGGWFGDATLAGGGAVMDHTVHVADLLRYIWEAEFASVYAEADTRHYDIRVDDCGMLMITMTNGMVVSLDTSWSRPAAAFPTWGDVTMEVTTMNGVMSIDVFGPHVDVYSNARGKAAWAGYGVNLDRLMITDWINAVRHGTPAPISGEDGLRAVALVEAAYRSAQSHQPESV
jgi:predicted dehydrogenase